MLFALSFPFISTGRVSPLVHLCNRPTQLHPLILSSATKIFGGGMLYSGRQRYYTSMAKENTMMTPIVLVRFFSTGPIPRIMHITAPVICRKKSHQSRPRIPTLRPIKSDRMPPVKSHVRLCLEQPKSAVRSMMCNRHSMLNREISVCVPYWCSTGAS